MYVSYIDREVNRRQVVLLRRSGQQIWTDTHTALTMRA